jgi:hypothetical protein
MKDLVGEISSCIFEKNEYKALLFDATKFIDVFLW